MTSVGGIHLQDMTEWSVCIMHHILLFCQSFISTIIVNLSLGCNEPWNSKYCLNGGTCLAVELPHGYISHNCICDKGWAAQRCNVRENWLDNLGNANDSLP